MHADAERDALVRRDARIAFDHRALNLESAAQGVDHASKFDDQSVACALDDPAMMDGDCRVDQVAAQRAEARQDPFLVGAGEPAVADNVRRQNRSEFPSLGHPRAPRARTQFSTGQARTPSSCCDPTEASPNHLRPPSPLGHKPAVGNVRYLRNPAVHRSVFEQQTRLRCGRSRLDMLIEILGPPRYHTEALAPSGPIVRFRDLHHQRESIIHIRDSDAIARLVDTSASRNMRLRVSRISRRLY